MKRPIEWNTKIHELTDIIDQTADKIEPQKFPEYDLIPKRPIRDFFRKLLK
ncbi:hypothetical protein M0R72_15520 [Candidatus Pacearchaeota archaeon]|nr:hypothetical protein [Candidatus Pacearchaeota archaeon]